jgi:O-antigen ligase/Tfp pilus assembly protein PilF
MSYVPYLRWGVLAGIFLIPFVSFIVATGGLMPAMFFPYITGKNFAFRIIVEILLGLYVLLALREPKYRPRPSLIMWAMLGFVVWMGFATALSVDPVKSFWSNFERMEGYVSLLHLFAYFVITGAVLTAERLWERFLQTSVGISVFQGFIVVFQVTNLFGFAPSSQSGARADGTFGNATYLAVFLLVNTFITLYLLARAYAEGRRPSAWWQFFYGLALVLQVIGIFLTQTRGAMLGLAAGLVVAALYVLWQAQGPQWRTLKRVAVGAMMGVVVLGSAIFIFKDTAFVQSIPGVGRLATMSFQETTVMSRLNYIWPVAFQGAAERPITGWGQENFNFVFNKYYDPGLYGQEEWFDRAHNQFLDWLIAGGFPAFTLYLSLYLLAAWAVFRSRLGVPEQAALLGLLAAYGFHNLFVFDNLISAIYFFTILALVHGFSRQELPGWMFLVRPASDRALAIAAPVVGVAVVFALMQFNGDGMARAQTLLRAIQPSSDLSININAFEGTLGQGSLGRQEVVEQLMQFASNLSLSEASPELKERSFNLAQEATEAMLAARPADARLELIYGSFLAQYGQLNEALAHLEEAQRLSPRKQRIFFQLGLLHLQGGDTTGAVEYFKQAYDLEPRYGLARIMYASGLFYEGRTAEADVLLIEQFGTVTPDDQRLLQVYADIEAYDRVIGIWQARVENDPDNAQTHIGLATAHFSAGDNAGAIAELEIAARLNPSLAPQVRSAIEQIQAGTLRP